MLFRNGWKDELAWIIGILLFTLIALWVSFGTTVFINTDVKIPYRLSKLVTVHLEVNRWMVFFPLYFTLLWLSYLLKEGFLKFKRVLPGLIILLTSASLVVVLALWIQVLKPYEYSGSMEFYPPFNLLTGSKPEPNADVRLTLSILYSMIGCSALSFLLVGYKLSTLRFRNTGI